MDRDVFNALYRNGQKYGLPPEIWYPIVMTESGGNPAAVSKEVNGHSYGLFQIYDHAHPEFDVSRYTDIDYQCEFWMPKLYEVYIDGYNKGLRGVALAQYVEQNGEKPQWTETVANNIAKYYNQFVNGNVTFTATSTNNAANYQTQYRVDRNTYTVTGPGFNRGALFGRRYRILVSTKSGQTYDVSDLHVIFNITKLLLPEQQYSQIEIYNLNADTEADLISNADYVIVEAGYEGNNYGKIYEGYVIQGIREKQNGTDYVLTLICVDGDLFINSGLSTISLPRGQTARTILTQIANKASNPIELGSISQSLSEAKLTRGKVIFGMAKDYINDIARTSGCMFHIENNKVQIINVTDPVTTKDGKPINGEVVELNPRTGLVGNVQQTDQGIRCKCLINPLIVLGGLIHINNQLITEAQFTQGKSLQNLMLDKEGLYRVIKITYSGDSRGNDWYMSIDALTQAGFIPTLLANSQQTPNAGGGNSANH